MIPTRFIAVDIGKTKTVAVMFNDDLEVLCSVSSGPADITLDEDVIKRNISDAIGTCCRASSTSLEDVDLIVFSWAGLDTKRDFDIAWSYVRELGYPIQKVIIEHDAVTAFYAVTWGEPGVAVIAGTGAIAFGMDRYGRRARSSGWGWIIGDEGSASWIALQALNAVSRAYDGRGRYTSLVDRVKEFYGVDDLLEIVTYIYRMKPLEIGKIAAIAVLVDEEAEKGDDVAKEIMERAGLELALTTYNVAQKLGMVNEEIIVGGIGSVFKSKIVSKVFEDNIKSLLRRARVKEPIIGYRAVLGPIIIALKRLNVSIDNNVVDRILKGIERAEDSTIVV